MSKHTPGPWFVFPPHAGGWDYALVGPREADHYVAAVRGVTGWESNDHSTRDANARLVAAAPDLLAAAQAVDAAWKRSASPDWSAALDMQVLREAIEKATKGVVG